MDKGGRPSKMTPEVIKKLEEVFAMDGSIGEACYYADISKVTYHDWIKKNPELANRFEALRERPVLKARQEVMKGLNNYQNAMDYLKRKKKLEFSERVEMTGADGKDLMPTGEQKEKTLNAIQQLINDTTGNNTI